MIPARHAIAARAPGTLRAMSSRDRSWCAVAAALACALAGCRDRGRPAPGRDAALAADAAPTIALDAAALDRVAAIAVPDATVRVLARGERDLALAVIAADARVAVTVAGCLGCAPIELAAWTARRAELAALLAPGVDATPPVEGARLTVALRPVGATPTIAIYARRGAGAGATWIGQWNDGATQVVATCELAALAADQPSPCAPRADAALAAVLAALRGR